ncbi:hypothetical protein HPB48_011320 [Haemaphysalis longicornis]|uniref:Uncharacterized protein n=1 Tax=Haemaphysalis longicornis TaxID=44386 RepID=A0A9J6G1Z0_HAELO|nr:hypothetical protein HPB48_011320 [Haemaphysalis longicornis]
MPALRPKYHWSPQRRDRLICLGSGLQADTGKSAQLLKGQLGTRPPIFVSVTMKGRLYKPLSPGIFGILAPCASQKFDQDIAPLSVRMFWADMVCDTSGYIQGLRHDKKNQAITSYNKAAGYTIVFDNSETLRKKVCDAKKGYAADEIGLAVFDVNYDNGTTSCQPKFIKGNGDRIRMMKKILKYFRDDYKDASKAPGCHSLT